MQQPPDDLLAPAPPVLPAPTKTNPRVAIIVSVLVGAFVLAVFAVNWWTHQGPAPVYQVVTMDGDDGKGTIVDSINIWRKYTDRNAGVVAQVHPGDRVTMLQRSGDGVRIRLADGREGWVTYTFIKELK